MKCAIAFLLGPILSSLLLIGCDRFAAEPTPADLSQSLPIGVALAQSSNLALLGQESVNGAKIAEQYFNAQGGINGKPLKLVFQDAGGDEAGAINAFQTLITKNKVLGIVGPSSSQQAFSANPLADLAKVPVVGPTNTAEGVPEIGYYIARVASPVTVLAPNSIRAAMKLNPAIRTVAVFYAQNDAFSQSETEIFQKAIRAKGLSIVTVQKFQTTDSDFQTQATAAMNRKPDLIVISSLAADGANLVRQLRELGYRGLIVSGNGLNTPNIFPVCGRYCDGVLIAQAYSPNHPNAINQAFRAAYQRQYNQDPPQFSAQGFTAVQVFVEALRSLDKTIDFEQLSRPEIRIALNEEILAGKYETPLGKISFTPEGEVIQQQFYVAQVKVNPDGKTGTFEILQEKF